MINSKQILTSGDLHPDSLILATGDKNGSIQLWDIPNETSVINLEGHENQINSICFSENGYHMASSSKDGNIVKLWDLRKTNQSLTIELENKIKINKVKFDPTGHNLAVAEDDLRLINCKNVNEQILISNNSQKCILDMKFEKDFGFLASVSGDSFIKICTPKSI